MELDQESFQQGNGDVAEWKQQLPEPVGWEPVDVLQQQSHVEEAYQPANAEEAIQSEILLTGDVTADNTLEDIDDGVTEIEDEGLLVTQSTDQAERSPATAMARVAEENESFAAIFTDADTNGNGIPDQNLEAVYDADSQAAKQVIERTDGEYRSVLVTLAVNADHSERNAVEPFFIGHGLRQTMWLGSNDRAATPLVGNILLVAVTLAIAVVLTTVALAFLDDVGTPTPDAAFEYERTSAGLEMTPKALGTDVVVQLNGEPVASLDADAAGRPVLVPTAPGDRITVVSEDEDREVLINREIDSRSEIGDFIAYYTFDSGNQNSLEDRSGNGNNGTIRGDPDRTGNALRFDGANDEVEVSDFNTPVSDVEEFTVAVAYKQRGNTSSSDGVSQLVEHQFQGGTNEWYLETSEAGSGAVSSSDYSIDYAVEFDNEVVVSEAVERETRHVAVGTFDGEEYALYVDGNREGTGSHSEEVKMGDMSIAEDFEQDNQHFNGDIYEIRLYYTAFEGDDIEVITNAMS